jgi:hypothetical protein
VTGAVGEAAPREAAGHDLLSRKVQILAVVVVAAIGMNAAMTASSAHASLVRSPRVRQHGDAPASRLSNAANTLTTWCLINRERKAAGVGFVSINTQLLNAAMGHATRSVQGKWWDDNPAHPNGWQLSHEEPGNSASFDQQIIQRIQGAGYCAGGSNWGGAEITYGGPGANSTPKAAVRWWMSTRRTGPRCSTRSGSRSASRAFSGSAFADTPAPAGTYVVEFGHCS